MKWVLLVVIAVVVLAAAGVLLYFFVFRGGTSSDPCETVCSRLLQCAADEAAKGGVKVDSKKLEEGKAECVKGCRKKLKPEKQREALKCTKVSCDEMMSCFGALEESGETEPAEPAKGGGGGDAAAGGGGGGGGGGAAAAESGGGGGEASDCVAKMTACLAEAAGASGAPAGAAAMMQESARQTCDGLRTGNEAAFDKAFAACKDKPCGMGGAEFLQCMGQQTVAAAAAGT